MDLDLGQVRAFLAVADERHFGHAAEGLRLSQQALSKRVARLEENLGVRLFDREKHAVELTEAGRRFLDPARQALAAGDSAVDAARREERPLRVDVWGHMYAPMRTVRQALDATSLNVELGTGRDLPSVITSLRRGELDVGFGRVNPVDGLDALTHRLVRLEPVDVIMSPDHPLADRVELRPGELSACTLWFPAALERLDFLARFSARFDVPGEFGGVNLGPDAFLDHLRRHPEHIALYPADAPLPGIRAIPLTDPTPLYAWSLVWRATDQHPAIEPLLRGFAEAGRDRRWLEYDPARDWLPDPDRAAYQVS